MTQQLSNMYKHTDFYPFDSGAALHRQGTHNLWVLNTSAAALWCLLDSNRDTDHLVNKYARIFNLDIAAAKTDVQELLNQFESISANQDGQFVKKTYRKVKPKENFQRQSALDAELLAKIKPIIFNVAGQWFSVRCSHKVWADQWRQLVKPLLGIPNLGQPTTELVVMPDAGGQLCVWKDSIPSWTGLKTKNIVPHLIYQVFDHICSQLQNKLLIHAAVLSKNNQAILFPGQPAAGKSTLTAALTKSGWKYLSDEMAIIDPKTQHVEPYPMPIGLKQKSVTPLAEFMPDLKTEKVHQRADSQKVRYIIPEIIKSKGSQPIRAIIFPKYSPNAKTQLTKIDPLNTLKQLTATGSSERSLTENDIKTLITLAQKQAYNLRINNLKTAIKLIQDIWNR